MVRIGRMNHLKVVNLLDFGAFLDGGMLEDILLPKRFVPEGCQVGDELDVFIYLDSDDVPIATTLRPKAQVGQFACLKVTDTNRIGAFLDWNMPKELLVPFSEQKDRMIKDQFYVVYIYQEQQSYRIVASSKISKFLSTNPHRYGNGQAVSLMVCDRTDIGYTAIVDNKYLGVIFDQDIDRPIRMGMKFDGFIKRVRPDQKLDLCLKKPGFDKQGMNDLGTEILERLKAQQGFLPFNDRTDPAVVKREFSVSKRVFKMAIGGLYKERLIRIDEDGIRLL
ncbi:S1 RNA-binding domain-containing protein [Endozoicomonas atrinae]|uniref:CvfB family protein n=1 Tax=Endozoicomonas atrinae TaxID=1333660 RepID=UPI0008257C8A|nr:S1-like domain-containing RNA-binding protein [Endozoicomonas atrinae]